MIILHIFIFTQIKSGQRYIFTQVNVHGTIILPTYVNILLICFCLTELRYLVPTTYNLLLFIFIIQKDYCSYLFLIA